MFAGRFFPAIGLLGGTFYIFFGGQCGKEIHVTMQLWGNPLKLLLPSGPSAPPEGESPFASWCVWGLVLSKLRAEQHARGKPNNTLYTNSYVIEANWSFPECIFRRMAGTYPNERNEPIIIVIIIIIIIMIIVNDCKNDSNDNNTRIIG